MHLFDLLLLYSLARLQFHVEKSGIFCLLSGNLVIQGTVQLYCAESTV